MNNRNDLYLILLFDFISILYYRLFYTFLSVKYFIYGWFFFSEKYFHENNFKSLIKNFNKKSLSVRYNFEQKQQKNYKILRKQFTINFLVFE